MRRTTGQTSALERRPLMLTQHFRVVPRHGLHGHQIWNAAGGDIHNLAERMNRLRDILDRLRLDPGSLTLGQLLQDREAAAHEIQRLRDMLDRTTSSNTARRGAATIQTARTEQLAVSSNVLLRLPEVCQRLGLSRATIYKWISEGRFPAPVQVSQRSVRWRAEEINQWAKDLRPR